MTSRQLARLFAGAAVFMGVLIGLAATQLSPMLLLAAVAGLAAVAISVVRVDLGLMLLVFITYTRFSDIAIEFHGAPSVAKFYIAFLLVVVLLRWIFLKERPDGWQTPLLLLTLYGALGLAAFLYAVDPVRVADGMSDYIKDALIVIMVTILLDRISILRGVVWSLLGAGIFLGTISVIQFLTGTFSNNYGGFALAPVLQIVGETNNSRLSGPIGDPNFYAQIMLVLLPLAFDRVIHEDNRWLRLAAVWALIVSFLTVAFTFSRGAFVAGLLVGVLMLFYYRPRPIVLAGLGLAGLLMLPLIPPEYTARILTLAEFTQKDEAAHLSEPSFRGRVIELVVGANEFLDHPVIGVGMYNFESHYAHYARSVGLADKFQVKAAHNLYLEVAAETGVVGIAVFGLLLGTVFGGIWYAWKLLRGAGLYRSSDLVAAVGFSILGYFAAAIFIHPAYPRYLWLLVGIGLSLPRLARHEINQDNPVRLGIE